MSQIDERTIGILCYITPIGWIVAFILHNNNVAKSEAAAFHLRQALGVYATVFVLHIIAYIFLIIPFIGGMTFAVAKLLTLVLWGMGIYYAIENKQKEIPFVGAIYQALFAGI